MQNENEEIKEPTAAEKLLIRAIELIQQKYRPCRSVNTAQYKLTTEQLLEPIATHIGVDIKAIHNPEFVQMLEEMGYTYDLTPGTFDFVWLFNDRNA